MSCRDLYADTASDRTDDVRAGDVSLPPDVEPSDDDDVQPSETAASSAQGLLIGMSFDTMLHVVFCIHGIIVNYASKIFDVRSQCHGLSLKLTKITISVTFSVNCDNQYCWLFDSFDGFGQGLNVCNVNS